MKSVYSMTREDFNGLLRQKQISSSHCKGILSQVYRDFNINSRPAVLPKSMGLVFESLSFKNPIQVKQVFKSRYDLSVKFVLALEDGNEIETVLMPESKRLTVCVSTQVGCRQGCRFCHTGRMGLRRHLKAEEIIGQITFVQEWIKQNWQSNLDFQGDHKVSNVVFMGMGEPLDNLDAVIPALRIMTDPWGLGLAPRRVTVSTAGHLDGLKSLVDSGVKTALALSLHSPFLEERSRLMPINRRFPLDQVLSYLDQLTVERNRHCLVQYTLIGGKNDTLTHAKALGTLLQGRRVKVNLIPYNPIENLSFVPPSPESVKAFSDILSESGLRVMVRYSKGQDIAAACGQLVRKHRAKL